MHDIKHILNGSHLDSPIDANGIELTLVQSSTQYKPTTMSTSQCKQVIVFIYCNNIDI